MTELNREQRTAVEANDGPVLIVAGPGTGKTKTLTARIAYLVERKHAQPEQILALTFTKKAAEEMHQRVRQIMQGETVPHISTFHAMCYELLGGNMEFIAEQERLGIIKSLSRPAALKTLSAREVGLLISKAKNGQTPGEAAGKIAKAYDDALRLQGLNDFDDLLVKANELLKDDEEARRKTQSRHKYILVDEFQDTNRLQYELLRFLNGHDNLFVIGDPNQSIYGFRGAHRSIFEQFEQDSPDVRKITLHVNYRSAPSVVDLSNAVFADTQLEAHSSESGQVRAVEVLNEYSEANWVINHIQKAIGGGDFLRAVSDDERAHHRTLKDFAVLYRSRSAAIALQKAFDNSGLPYQVAGDGSPYEQPVVQDVIKLMKAIASGEDAEVKGVSKTQCRVLLSKIDKTLPPSKIPGEIIKLFGFEQSPELTQLSNMLVRFDSLQAALGHLDVISEQQFYDPGADAVTLMTIHAAKGLEFQHVFLVGAEEGILPHNKSNEDEERRLFYVAVTRAHENLDILHTKTRGGKPAKPSHFIVELSNDILPKTVDENIESDKRRAHKRKLKRSQQKLF